ncbi:large ribosomal subunit protein bL12-like [Zophobas morio]|uniref:large ribosomal subunit protein bL12-like n=1 Tax=Zophobas morio TaxID=2755281 RepID=UPI003082EFD9
MAQSSAPGSTTSAAAQPTEEEKKEFCVKLVGWTDATQKVALTRELKKHSPQLNLVQAKKCLDNCSTTPHIVKENIPIQEAEKLKSELSALGATVVFE